MEHHPNIDAVRDALKNENMWTDVPGSGLEWDHTAVMFLTQHRAEQTLRALCGPNITLATLLTQVSRSGLARLIDRLELRINTYAMGEEICSFGTRDVERYQQEYYGYRSLADTFERHGIIRIDDALQDEHTVFTFTLLEGSDAARTSRNEAFRFDMVNAGPTAQVSACFVGDGTRALTGSRDTSMTLWDLDRALPIRTFRGHTEAIWSIACTADGKRALTASGDTTLRLWDVDSGQCLRIFQGHEAPLRSVAISADGAFAVSGSIDSSLRTWNVETGECLRQIQYRQGRDFSETIPIAIGANRALARTDGRAFGLIELSTGKCLTEFKFVDQVLYHCAITGDGRYALAAHLVDRDDQPMNRLCLWDLTTLALVRLFEPYEGQAAGWGGQRYVHCLAINEEEAQVAAGYDDGTIRIWDYASGAFLGTIAAHGDEVRSIAFSKYGSMMLSTAMDHSIILWNTEDGTRLACFGDDSGTRENIRRAKLYAHAPDTPAVRPPEADNPPLAGPAPGAGDRSRPITQLKIPI
ncbi:WD40 repeat domain-containing protein [Massilia sp. CF038]|uniref:WD40 repeat domain-containing protein n=1 Tax=Massilia sp. CF038 TaxID=1881045 RepID=UPI000920B753|nr:WD40 repeat domain-containing protein [Massilia sp. CF038]SHG46960.1 WD40 repeat [Massilia sp. CF038]